MDLDRGAFDLIEDEQPSPYSNQVKNSFSSLFHLYLSGTHATIEQRLTVIESLLGSEKEQRREFGISALNAVLKTADFTSYQRFDFGARPPLQIFANSAGVRSAGQSEA